MKSILQALLDGLFVNILDDLSTGQLQITFNLFQPHQTQDANWIGKFPRVEFISS